MAGVPFRAVAGLATPATAEAARQLLVRENEFAQARAEVGQLLPKEGRGPSGLLLRDWRKAIQAGTVPAAVDPASRAFASCWECANRLAAAETNLTEVLQRELPGARRA